MQTINISCSTVHVSLYIKSHHFARLVSRIIVLNDVCVCARGRGNTHTCVIIFGAFTASSCRDLQVKSKGCFRISRPPNSALYRATFLLGSGIKPSSSAIITMIVCSRRCYQQKKDVSVSATLPIAGESNIQKMRCRLLNAYTSSH